MKPGGLGWVSASPLSDVRASRGLTTLRPLVASGLMCHHVVIFKFGGMGFFSPEHCITSSPLTRAFTTFHRLSVTPPEGSPASDRPYVVGRERSLMVLSLHKLFCVHKGLSTVPIGSLDIVITTKSRSITGHSALALWNPHPGPERVDLGYC